MQLLPSLLGTRLVSGFSSSRLCTNYHVGTAGSTGETVCPMLRSRIGDYLTVQMRQKKQERDEAAEVKESPRALSPVPRAGPIYSSDCIYLSSSYSTQ